MDKAALEISGPVRCHRVTFEPMGISCRASADQSLMAVAEGQHISLRSDCGGQGSCGQCMIAIHPVPHASPLTQSELAALAPERIQDGYRLACQVKLCGDATVSVSDDVLDSREAEGKAVMIGKHACDPEVKRNVLSGSMTVQPQDAAAKDLAGVIQYRAKRACGHEVMFREADALRMLSRLHSDRDVVTLVNHLKRGVTAVLTGNRSQSLGLAVDIGTTTLAVYLCDLRKGALLKAASAANPQRRFGEDVISRIAYANENDSGLQLLQKVVVDEINALTSRCVRESGADLQDIDEATVVGNTTMQQIFMSFHPGGLGASPYRPVSAGPQDVRAKDLGLALNPATNVHVFPVLSGFVGGDTMGVILSEKPHERDDITLIVDIGTNGELVLGNKDYLWTTSCATGPALEGAHIRCGMRATGGAIDKISINPIDFSVSYSVLGKTALARGICGSGIIDAIAGMLKAGLILPNGRIREGLPGVFADEKGIGRRFILVPKHESSATRDIYISLEDIRQVQLAKSALAVGIQLLMRKAGVEHIDRLVLTGAFGARFNWKNAVVIGMLPLITRHAEVKLVENAAGQGAIMALLNGSLRKHIHEVSLNAHVLELAQEPDFADKFSRETSFPEPSAS